MLALADVVAGQAFFMLGAAAGIAGFCALALLEAAVLRLLGWDGFRRSLLDALAMNLASTLLGILLNVFAVDLYEACGYDPSARGRWCAPLVSPWSLLVLAAVLTVLVEAGVLFLMRRRPARETWRASLACNAVSYMLVALLMVSGVM